MLSACLKEKATNLERKTIIMVMDRIALILAIIGGLNWGSVGIFRFDMIAALFGGANAGVARVIYTLIGLSALWCITLLFRERDVTGDRA